ncbi:MAG: methionyl-tRNA formyltransferase [Dehalococcoidia bacterium]|nr:methionyl-tRNA formyltransferase [Dehalococcoidia bacterium]
MRIVFMGTPQYSADVLQTLASHNVGDIVAVVTPPDRRRGRGRAIEASPVKQAADQLGLPIFQPESFRDEQVINSVRTLLPDMLIVVAYGLILPKAVLDIPKYGCLNLHPSLLPKYRGPSPVVSSIRAGDEVTGISLMLLDPGMDTGPVISQQVIEITSSDTAITLTKRLFTHGADLLINSIGPWASQNITAQPQNESEATITQKIIREDGLADWTLPSSVLDRYRRAFTPWPGLYSHWEGKLIKVLDTSFDESVETTKPPGSVLRLSNGKQGIGVTSGTGVLEINLLQLEGKSPITGADFLKGYPSIENAVLQ